MRALGAALAALLAAAGILAPSAPALAATCTTGLGGVCGPYPAGTTWSNGFNSYVTDQDVGCGADKALCDDRLTATGLGSWSLTSTMHDSAASCNQVHTYPDSNQLTTEAGGADIALGDYKTLRSTFSIDSPAVGSYEAAYDIWTSGRGSGEVMIWVDTQNHDHGEVASGAPKIAGQRFHVYTSGRKADPGEIVVKLDANESSGTVRIKATLGWLIRNGWLPSGLHIGQINFGWEICGTGGTPQTFSVKSYTLTGTK